MSKSEKTDLTDQSVLVTGGNSGIGEAVVRAFAGCGARVAFCGLDDSAGEALAAELNRSGATALYHHCDLRDATASARFVDAAAAAHGGLDVAVNAAAISLPPARVADIDPDRWRDVMATNVDGVFHAMRAELRHMQPANAGVVINIVSILADKAAPWIAAYGASKHAVWGLTRSAAAEYAGTGIRILAVSPGPVDTPMFRRAQAETADAPHKYAGGLPPGPIGRPEDVASLVLFLAGPEAAYINAANVIIDGGITGMG